MNKHTEPLRKTPKNVIEMLVGLFDEAEESGMQIILKVPLRGSPTLILGAEPEDFQPDDDDDL